MLCNELFDLMKEERDTLMSQRRFVDYNIHQWRCPSPTSPPATSSPTSNSSKSVTATLRSSSSCASSPTCTRSTRSSSRFSALASLASSPRPYDAPARDAAGVGPNEAACQVADRLVQGFLEKHGRVDLDDARNDPAQFTDGAYSAAELAICRLELLAGAPPFGLTQSRH